MLLIEANENRSYIWKNAKCWPSSSHGGWIRQLVSIFADMCLCPILSFFAVYSAPGIRLRSVQCVDSAKCANLEDRKTIGTALERWCIIDSYAKRTVAAGLRTSLCRTTRCFLNKCENNLSTISSINADTQATDDSQRHFINNVKGPRELVLDVGWNTSVQRCEAYQYPPN